MRTLGWFCFWLLFFSALAFGGPALIQKGGGAYIRDQIKQIGLQNAEIDSIHLGTQGFTLSHIRLGEGDNNTIEEISGTYKLWPLIRGERQLDSLTIKGLSLEGTIDRETPETPYGLTFPFWPERFTLNTLTNREETSTGFTVPQLPFQKLTIEVATIRVLTPNAPLEFALDGEMTDRSAPDRVLEGHVSLAAKDRDLNFKTDGKMRLSVVSQSLEGSLHIAPHSFDVATFQAQYPSLMPSILQKGTVDVSGDISVNKEKDQPLTISGPLKIGLKNLSGQTDEIVLNQLNGGIEAAQILPDLQGDIQDVRLSSALLNETEFSTIRTHGQISGEIADPLLTLWDTQANVYDGQVTAPKIAYSLKNGLNENIRLQFSHFDLAQLIRLLDINGLRGKGQFSGEMTISKSGKILLINQGHIANLEDGYISYLPDQYPDALAGEDMRLQTVRDALTDFRFHDLQADISGPVSGDLKVSLKAKGTNKKLFDERPIHFNL
ncbi:MAG: YdbH domain-containing protein, partial [Pseudobdellovibrionaceae bacterium]